MNIKKSNFAGTWYPATPLECEREIKQFLQEGEKEKPLNTDFVAGIVPHAGWFFSGSIACNVVDALRGGTPPDIVVILGMHLSPDSPGYILPDGTWETPFGELLIDNQFAKEILKQFNSIVESVEPFEQDNTIELVTPFVKYFFPNAKILPMGIPPGPDAIKTGEGITRIAQKKGKKIKIIGSTDLTHYGPNYGFSPKGGGSEAIDWVRNENDKKFINAVCDLNSEKILKEAELYKNACCAGAAAATIAAAKALGAENGRLITHQTSYDKAPSDSFVGYAGIVM